MSFHLTEHNLVDIEAEIAKMRRVTWERVHARVQNKLGLPHSISTLKKNERIRGVYAAHKAALKAAKHEQKAKAAHARVPKDPAAHIAALEARESTALERLATILENAVQLGVPVERMEQPLQPVTYSPTPKRGS